MGEKMNKEKKRQLETAGWKVYEDEDGWKAEQVQPSGVKVTLLVEPSETYLAEMERRRAAMPKSYRVYKKKILPSGKEHISDFTILQDLTPEDIADLEAEGYIVESESI